MILANLGFYKLKATSGVKATSPAGAKRFIDSKVLLSMYFFFFKKDY
jgi:hypothetical protein